MQNCYSSLDLKDVFFSLLLALVGQPLFAFEWTDPKMEKLGQLTWTCLPQGFKNVPTLFDESLKRDLQDFWVEYPSVTVLQYTDDLIQATTDLCSFLETMKALLRDLDKLSYHVSAKKAQPCLPKVTYLGNILKKEVALLDKRIEVTFKIPSPKTKHQVRNFLGALSYCQLWILGFAEIAQPLYTSTGGEPSGSLTWTELEKQAFSAPNFALPDLAKPFQLYVADSNGIAKGV